VMTDCLSSDGSYLGFDIGGTKCTVVLSDRSGAIQAFRTVATDHKHGPAYMIKRLCAIARKLVVWNEVETVKAVGISCGGPLDAHEGVIYSPPNLPDWDAVPIVSLVEAAVGVPVGLQNDANACALAEWRFGAGRGVDNMVFLTFGTGMGAGLILDSKLYSGTNGMAGEIGHIRMESEGPVGYGKPGSFEGFCSGAGIAALAQAIIAEEWENNREVRFCRTVDERDRLTARQVGDAALAGDETAVRVIETSAEYLGRGLAMLVDMLNPERIVIGSIFVRLEQLFRPRMEEALQRESLTRSGLVCRVVPAALGEDVGKLAALSVAMQTAPPVKQYQGGTQ